MIMKRLFTFLFVLLTCITVNAQNDTKARVWKNSPNSTESNSSKLVGRNVTRAPMPSVTRGGNQMWWGYFNEAMGYGGIGTGGYETFDAAIYIPAGHSFVGKSTIKAIRIFFEDASAVSDVKVWISKGSLPETVSNADYIQDVVNASSGANDIELTNPFVVNNEAIYVGYTFTAGGYPIMQGGEYVENSLYLRSSQNTWSAIDYLGCLALQILIESDGFPQNMASPSNFKTAIVELGKSADVPVEILNGGGNTIENFSYTISSNGSTSAEKTISNVYIPYGAKVKVPVPFEADDKEGKVLKTLTITKINGKENTATEKSATGYLQTLNEIRTYPRTTLIEEFTTEYCGWCPTAAAEISSALSTYPEIAKRTAMVCHHAGYYTDWLTIDASRYYTWLYNDGGSTYAPAFMWDRYAEDGKTAVTGRLGNVDNYKSMLESRLARPAYAKVDLTANFSAEKNQIVVSANCERAWDFSDNPARITLILTEDNIQAQSQSGANGSFTHQHVARAVNETWGAVLDWNNNKASYRFTFDLDASWKTDDLKVVAFISNYDGSDATNCAVENAAVVVPGNDTPNVDLGNADGKGGVDANDVVAIVNYLMGKVSDGFNKDAADVNGDGKVDLADIVMLINKILLAQ
jgi:hypothetical protein